MKKEDVRKEFFKMKNKGFSYTTCRRLLIGKLSYEVSTRTLKRWNAKLNTNTWNLRDQSRKPQTLHNKVTPELIRQVCLIRKKTGWGSDKIATYYKLPISATTIKRIIKHQGLARTVHRAKRINWVRWQRKTPNSLWQIDHSDDQDAEENWTLSVIDDCSRYSLTLTKLQSVTTTMVTKILDELIKNHGKPREILSDNGSAYGGKNKHSKFDRWCKKQGIKHIRSSVHSPTTCGKVERLFKTVDQEISYSNNDQELFRLRYNHFRPHSSLNGKTPAMVYFKW